MARCGDCNKFVSYDDSIEPEISDEDLSMDEDNKSGIVSGVVRVILGCAECGTELKEAELNFEIPFEHACGGDEDRYELDNVDATFTSRMETHDSKGRPVKRRYAKTYYGADITVRVKCLKCKENIDLTALVEEQASAFSEI